MPNDARISMMVDGAKIAEQAFANVAGAVQQAGQKVEGLGVSFGKLVASQVSAQAIMGTVERRVHRLHR